MESRYQITARDIDAAFKKLDLSRIPSEQRENALEVARSLASNLANLTSALASDSLVIAGQHASISRTVFLWNQLLASSPVILAEFWLFDLLDWIKELLRPLFDNQGVDVTAGTVETSDGTAAGVGIEINIDGSSEAPEELPPPPPLRPPPDPPFPFEPPPKKPKIRIKVIPVFDLSDLVDELPDFPPSNLGSLTLPSIEPGDTGLFLGVEIRF